jgi:hypothetical protein
MRPSPLQLCGLAPTLRAGCVTTDPVRVVDAEAYCAARGEEALVGPLTSSSRSDTRHYLCREEKDGEGAVSYGAAPGSGSAASR